MTAVTVILRRLLGRKLGTRPARPGEHRLAVYPRARARGAVRCWSVNGGLGSSVGSPSRRGTTSPIAHWHPAGPCGSVWGFVLAPEASLAGALLQRPHEQERVIARDEGVWCHHRIGVADGAVPARKGDPPGALAEARRSGGGGGRAGVADLLPGFFFGGFQEFPRDGSHRYIAWLDGAWVGLGAGVDLHVGGKLGLGPDDLTSGSQPSLNSGHVPKVPGREGFSPFSAAATPPQDAQPRSRPFRRNAPARSPGRS